MAQRFKTLDFQPANPEFRSNCYLYESLLSPEGHPAKTAPVHQLSPTSRTGIFKPL